SGTDSYTYTESDGQGGTATGTVNVTVNPALVITTAALPDTQNGQNYNQALAATGGASPYAWAVSSGTLPGGMTFNNVTGVIGGSVVQSGDFTFTIQVKDSATPPQVATHVYTIHVGPPVVTTTLLPNATV